MKLFDSEWKVMEVLWQKNDRTAKEISLLLADSIGWNKNTTYTVIKKVHRQGRHRAAGAEFCLPRRDHQAAGPEGGGRLAGR